MTIIAGVGCRGCPVARVSRRAAYAAILPCDQNPYLHTRLSHKVGGSRGAVVGARKSRGHREGNGQQQTPRREIRDVNGVTVT